MFKLEQTPKKIMFYNALDYYMLQDTCTPALTSFSQMNIHEMRAQPNGALLYSSNYVDNQVYAMRSLWIGRLDCMVKYIIVLMGLI